MAAEQERITEAQYLAAHEQGFTDGVASVQAELQAAQEREKALTWLKGECPRGCGETLFVGEGGYVTCSYVGCPEPDAPHKALAAQRTEEPSERMFTFRTSSQDGASVRCHGCGWTAKGQYGKDVFPLADSHECQRTKGPYYGSLTKMRLPAQRTEEPSDG